MVSYRSTGGTYEHRRCFNGGPSIATAAASCASSAAGSCSSHLRNLTTSKDATWMENTTTNFTSRTIPTDTDSTEATLRTITNTTKSTSITSDATSKATFLKHHSITRLRFESDDSTIT